MPTPVGHALGGLIVALAMAPKEQPQLARDAHAASTQSKFSLLPDRRDLHGLAALTDLRVLCVLAACLPDIDFGWGRHNMETHSIGFALLLGAAALAWQRSARVAIACALAVGTHVLFDWLGSDDTPPLGVMALWPFSDRFYFADAFVFEAISRRYWLPGFLLHNTLAVLRELAILLPIVVGLVSFRKRFVSLGRD